MSLSDIFDREGGAQALDKASDAAGEVLAEINKTDLSTFTAEEWRTLLKTIIMAWESHSVPF